MTDTQLYIVPLSEDSQLQNRAAVRRNVQENAPLSGGSANAESLSLEPGERFLRGEYKAKYADLLASEVEMLFDAPDIEQVPYYAPNGVVSEAGYYTLRNVDVTPRDPRSDAFFTFDGVLKRVGSPETHFRAVRTAIAQVDQDFGNDQTALIGVPDEATKLRWVDEGSGDYEDVTVHSTVTGEKGDVKLYDARASTYTDPTLTYQLDYEHEWEHDVLVYDDRNEASRTDADDIVHWRHVFNPGWEPEGVLVVDNTRVRVHLDETNGLSVEEYTSGSWSDASLGTGGDAGNWSLFDVDVTYIDQVVVRVQTVWQDSSDGSFYHLNLQVARGYDTLQFYRAPNESAGIPSGLTTKLDPVADEQDFRPGASQTVLNRNEVRK